MAWRQDRPTHCSSSFASAGLVVIESLAFPCLKAPLLRWGSSSAVGIYEPSPGRRCRAKRGGRGEDCRLCRAPHTTGSVPLIRPSVRTGAPSPRGEGLRAATWGRPYGYHPDSAAGVNPRPTKFSRLKRLLFQVRRSRGIAIAAIFHPARAQWPGGNSDQPLRFCAPGILQNPAGTRLP